MIAQLNFSTPVNIGEFSARTVFILIPLFFRVWRVVCCLLVSEDMRQALCLKQLLS